MESPDLDLVLAGPSGIRILENRFESGKRQWVDHTDGLKLPSLHEVRWFLVCDIESDGKPDVVVGSQDSVVILRNQGSWSFVDITDRSPVKEVPAGEAAEFADFKLKG